MSWLDEVILEGSKCPSETLCFLLLVEINWQFLNGGSSKTLPRRWVGRQASLEKWLRDHPVQQDRGEKGQHVFRESPVVQPAQGCGREDRLMLCSPRP